MNVLGDAGGSLEIQGFLLTGGPVVALIWAVVGFAGGWLVRWGSAARW